MLSSPKEKADTPNGDYQERKSSTLDDILSVLPGATSITLSTLRDAAALAPVPFLAEAAGLAVTIFDTIQTCSNNKGEFRSLAADSCSLVYAVISTCNDLTKDGSQISSQLQTSLEQLCTTLTEIKNFAQKQAKRKVFIRFLTSKDDQDKIQSFRQQMRQSLDVFTLQSHITVQQIVLRIAEQQKIQEQIRGEEKKSLPDLKLKLDTSSETSPTSADSPTSAASPVSQVAFSNLFAGASQIGGNIQFTNVTGNQHNVHTEDHSTSDNFDNVYNTNNINSNNVLSNHLSLDDGSDMSQVRGRKGRAGRGRVGRVGDSVTHSRWYPNQTGYGWPTDKALVPHWIA